MDNGQKIRFQKIREFLNRPGFNGFTKDDLFILSFIKKGWGFPAMTTGILKVYGDLLEFNDIEILNRIDMLEGFRGIDSPYNFYTRKEIQVFKDKNTINAWVYFLEKDRILDDNGLLISSGKWGKYRYSS